MTRMTWIAVLGVVIAVLQVFAADAEELTVAKLAVPFAPGERAFCVTVADEGRLLAYQSERAGGHGKQDIWLSRLENGRWSEPRNAGPGVNTASQDVDAKLSPDGRTMVFIRGDNFRESSTVFVSNFRNGAWQPAEAIGPPVSVRGTVTFGAILTADGKRLYFSSNRPGGQGGFDHYYSDRTARGWSEPVNLGAPVNTAENDVDVAVSADGRTLVFPAKRADSIGGSTDLYVSRWENGAWSEPVNLGPRINTPVTDTCPWLGYDGRTLYVNTEWEGVVAGRKAPTSIWLFRSSRGF